MLAKTIEKKEYAQRGSLLHNYSFEISAKDANRLEAIRPLVPADTVVSITYLPSESDEARIEAAREVRRIGLIPMPHIAARRIQSADILHHFVDRVANEAEVNRLFIIAGDLSAPLGPFEDSLSVIRDARLGDYGIRTIGIAGYPEGHPQISAEALQQAMANKITALSTLNMDCEIMTQFAFDAEAMLAWLSKLRAGGVQVPVRLGLPGPANVGTLLRFAARCGVGASAKVMAKYGASITKLLNTARPDRLFDELSRSLISETHGDVSIHLYPFGGLQKMSEWASCNAHRASH